ncbi:7-cyano-7-deazaguanine/7-aminomethyl-7-deazaguanine transporter [Celerinatantimonas yamalensis]|uniref:Probable queuosine precursor transporter n=1 Tax=Celerinatantimonas yamalensis TaxID=559956 RepID=A0ABW9G5V0_9GAMM
MSTHSLPRLRAGLTIAHVTIIICSNYLVQFPLTFANWHSTWAAFCFPFIFVMSDLTVRLYGYPLARRVIIQAMVPALAASYLLNVLFASGQWQGFGTLGQFNSFAGRIALASFSAYLAGQLLDIIVFRRLRRLRQWWAAPAGSAIIGNLADTFIFFSVAFYAGSNPFMTAHWVSIAEVDYWVKLMINIILFLPLYGVILTVINRVSCRIGNATSA